MENRSRLQLFVLFLLCLMVTPVLLLGLLAHVFFGSRACALRMAIAFDECGNAMFGGNPTETISSHVGRMALKGGWRWRAAQAMIDAFFGHRHCEKAIFHAIRYRDAFNKM